MKKSEHKKLLNEIVSKHYNDIVKISHNLNQITNYSNELMDDFIQEICLSLLEYPNDKLIESYLKNEHIYLIKKIIRNNLLSTTSPFYSKYIKYEKNKNKLTDNEEETDN